LIHGVKNLTQRQVLYFPVADSTARYKDRRDDELTVTVGFFVDLPVWHLFYFCFSWNVFSTHMHSYSGCGSIM